jgi:hypothetical protein
LVGHVVKILANYDVTTTVTRSTWLQKSFRISYLDTSMFADERLTAGTSQTEEFSTEPAALARARELIEDSHYRAISFTGNSERRPENRDQRWCLPALGA